MNKIIIRAFSSATILTIVLLFATILLINQIAPLRYFIVRGAVLGEQEYIRKKFYEAVRLEPQRLFLGSSLLLCATRRADTGTDSDSPHQLEDYRFARTFDEKIARDNIVTYNLALSGLLVSDYKRLLTELLEAGRRPKSVYVFVGFRDFIDNFRLDGAGSHVSVFFDGRSTPLTRYLPGLSGNYLLEHHEELKTVFLYYACQILRRPPQLQASGELQKLEFDRLVQFNNAEEKRDRLMKRRFRNDMQSDLIAYRKRYLPIDSAKLDREMQSFESLLDLCARSGIEAKVVFMPVSCRNAALLPGLFQEQFLQKLRSLSQARKVALYEFQPCKDFQDSDFEDSVHLNAAGAQKFWQCLKDQSVTSR
ncbi:MAG: hypothetical protein K2Y32_04220 [Candidatus Obscuribacterales bacterium]|nr:hypothetical protein [Candidatus Obscuribacterales bacterium]